MIRPSLGNMRAALNAKYDVDLNDGLEIYRMVQKLKMDGRVDFDWRAVKWYVPKVAAVQGRSLGPAVVEPLQQTARH